MKPSGRFDARRDAEMAVERLAQDDVTIAASADAAIEGRLIVLSRQ